MITTRIIPVATATEQVFLVEIVERLCRKYCQNASVQPTGEVTFSVSPVRVVNGYAVATITANVSTLTPKCQHCGCAEPQVFTETFDVAFTATATNVITIEKGATTLVEPAYRGCCAARGVKLTTTLTVTIA